MTHLNDISKVYLEEVAKKKEDNQYLETDFKKRQENNEKARKDLMKGPQMKNPHFEEKDPFGRPGGKYGGVPKKGGGYDRAYQANMKKIKELEQKEALDPVGQEDADVDNDGKENTKSDKYLLKRRKAISKAMKEAVHSTAKQMHSPHEVPSGNLKDLVKKAVKRIDTDVDGDTDNNDKAKGELGEFIPGVGNKRLYSTTRTTTAKESFSNWRNDLREIAGEIRGYEKKTGKKNERTNVNNTININPKLSEGVTILEMVEISEEQEIQTLSHAVDFFFEEGINEDGLEMIIEDLGLEEFVDLVYEIGYETLTEARTLVTKKKTPKKLPKGTAPAKTTKARVVKSGTTMKAAAPSGAFKRRPAAAKAVETAKQEQPKKKPVRDAIARGIFRAVDAYKAGMERHRQATKGMGKAAKETGKTIAKAAKVTHEAGRRAGESKVGQAVKKAGAAAIKTGVKKAKEGIKSLKKEELELQEKPFDVYDTRNDVYLARGLKTRKGARRRADRADTEYGAITTKVIPTGDDRPEVKYKTKKEELELQEKSMSVSQQQAAGAALAAKRGEIDPSELKGASIQMYKSMSEKELRDFAKTKHKGLPKKKEVEEAVEAPKKNDKKEEQMKKQQLAKQQEMIKKLQMLQRQKLQMQRQGRLPMGTAMEETAIDKVRKSIEKEYGKGMIYDPNKPKPKRTPKNPVDSRTTREKETQGRYLGGGRYAGD